VLTGQGGGRITSTRLSAGLSQSVWGAPDGVFQSAQPDELSRRRPGTFTFGTATSAMLARQIQFAVKLQSESTTAASSSLRVNLNSVTSAARVAASSAEICPVTHSRSRGAPQGPGAFNSSGGSRLVPLACSSHRALAVRAEIVRNLPDMSSVIPDVKLLLDQMCHPLASPKRGVLEYHRCDHRAKAGIRSSGVACLGPHGRRGRT
jgi:hypothetical protein